MTSLFLLHAFKDATYAETLYTDLESQGYHTWRKPHKSQISDSIYPHTIENAILGSAVVLLIWSINAIEVEELRKYIYFALDLKKPILPLVLDQTNLPATLSGFTPFMVESPCTGITTQLIQQSLLPPPDSINPLITLAQLAASSLQSERKAAVKQAKAMLQRNKQHAAVLAILIYLAQDDPKIKVREWAKEVLDADASPGKYVSP